MLFDARAEDRTALGRGVEQAHRQLDHPHAVGDGVVCPQDHSAAAPVAVHPDGLPQGPVTLEHLGAVARHERLQFTGVVGVLQVDDRDVHPEVEIVVELPPPRAVAVLDRPAAEHGVAGAEAFLGDLADPAPVERFGGPDHRVDDHEVVGPVHFQPQRVLDAEPASVGHRAPPTERSTASRAPAVHSV